MPSVSSSSSSVSTYPLIDVNGVRSSCETLATKSFCARSICSTRVTSRSTATAPPCGIGAAFTSKILPGTTDVARPSDHPAGQRRPHAGQHSGSRIVCTSACPTRTEPLAGAPGISRRIGSFVH